MDNAGNGPSDKTAARKAFENISVMMFMWIAAVIVHRLVHRARIEVRQNAAPLAVFALAAFAFDYVIESTWPHMADVVVQSGLILVSTSVYSMLPLIS